MTNDALLEPLSLSAIMAGRAWTPLTSSARHSSAQKLVYSVDPIIGEWRCPLLDSVFGRLLKSPRRCRLHGAVYCAHAQADRLTARLGLHAGRARWKSFQPVGAGQRMRAQGTGGGAENLNTDLHVYFYFASKPQFPGGFILLNLPIQEYRRILGTQRDA